MRGLLDWEGGRGSRGERIERREGNNDVEELPNVYKEER